VTVTWQTGTTTPPPPPPGPAVPPIAGSLKVAVTATPYTSPAGALGSSKHLDFARIGNRWYKMVGDHAAIESNPAQPMPAPYTTWPPDTQDGRQEMMSVNFAANDWRKETTYYMASGVQQAFPDDAFTIARNGEAFVFVSATAQRTPPFQPAGKATQLWGRITAFNPATGTYRDVAPYPTNPDGSWSWGNNRAWRGTYDVQKDRLIIPVRRNELEWIVLDGATGADLTQRSSNGYPKEWGSHDFHSAGIVGDPTSRTRYVYDYWKHELYSVDLDTFALTLLTVLPEPAGQSGDIIRIVYHPVLKAVVVATSYSKKLYLYEPAKNALTTLTRTDGFTNAAGDYVPPSTMEYDPDTGDIVSIGGIDWDGMKSTVYWRLNVTP